MDVNSELRDAQVEIKDADEAYNVNKKGLLWFNRTADKVKMIFNSAVKILATEEYVDAQVAASEASLNATGLITDVQGSDPATPSSGESHFYAKSGGYFFKDDAGSVSQFATSSDLTSGLGGLPFQSVITQSVSIGSSPSVLWSNNTGKDCVVFYKSNGYIPCQIYWTSAGSTYYVFGGATGASSQMQGAHIVPAGGTNVFGNVFGGTGDGGVLYIFPIG